MTVNDSQLARARSMGERAGREFVDTGIWPVCPFKGEHPTQVALAAAWTDGAFSVVGPGLAPRGA